MAVICINKNALVKYQSSVCMITLVWRICLLIRISYQVTCWGSTCKECDQAHSCLIAPCSMSAAQLSEGYKCTRQPNTSAEHSPFGLTRQGRKQQTKQVKTLLHTKVDQVFPNQRLLRVVVFGQHQWHRIREGPQTRCGSGIGPGCHEDTRASASRSVQHSFGRC